jgi:hypothetical protein
MHVASTQGTNLETKLLKIYHMLRPKFFYFGPSISISGTNILKQYLAENIYQDMHTLYVVPGTLTENLLHRQNNYTK